MPNEKKKMFPRKGTGTVPKCKYRNNISDLNHNDGHRNVLPNNLGSDWQRHEFSNYSRYPGRNFYPINSYMMETPLTEEQNQYARPSESSHLNLSVNGTLSTPNTSGSASRRDSVGTIPKCDNVTKYPDKKQIEDKLNQIREYLRVTTSLMSSIKNNEDQNAEKEREQFKKMIKDLKDSEAKLVALLSDTYAEDVDEQTSANNVEGTENGVDNSSEPSTSGNLSHRNELEEKVEQSNRKLQLLRAQQNELINLKQRAENQLRNARQAQEEYLLMEENQIAANVVPVAPLNHVIQQQQQQQQRRQEPQALERNENKNTDEEFEAVIRELEGRLHSLSNDYSQSAASGHVHADPDYLQDRLDSSNQLIHILGSRDAQLNTEHVELQDRLSELQSKKNHIDSLVDNLQSLNCDEDEDIGSQVRKIVSMKQQLSKLKDMLEIVKSTETALEGQNVNGSDSESQDNANALYAKTDNLHQNARRSRSHEVPIENKSRFDNNAPRLNEFWVVEKDSNKSAMNMSEREKMLAELRAKKRELEEIMYKQKDRTLINNDVCSESSLNKSDVGPSNGGYEGPTLWLPMATEQRNRAPSGYSSDDCPEDDINEYSELNSSGDANLRQMMQPGMTSSYSAPNFTKRRDDPEPSVEVNHSREYPARFRHISPHNPNHSVRSASAATSGFDREKPRTNNEQHLQTKNQLQKQLELIQSVCQSMIEQETTSQSNLRNNLTPSPLYAEPRRYASPNPQVNTLLNVVNPASDMPWFQPTYNNSQCYPLNDVANNQNMLAANTLQTQAFLLNTLNQCCQMLWFQQREIASLRNMMCAMQDRAIGGQSDQPTNTFSSLSAPYVFPPRPGSVTSNVPLPQSRPAANPKVNQQVSAACSLPNLNEPHTSQTNIDSNMRSTPSARLLDSGLNNAVYHGNDQPANNTVLPSVNANVNQPLPSQIWNGQALNNQVAPGNRANNYWDNFRSYSRQNLLSTSSKSNEGLQNPSVLPDRSNSHERSFSVSLPLFTIPKLNVVHNESVNLLEENTPSMPRRHLQFKTTQNLGGSNKMPQIPPDVLNINHNINQKTSEQRDLNEVPMHNFNHLSVMENVERNIIPDLQPDLSLFENNEAPLIFENRNLKDSRGQRNRNDRNEWHDEDLSDNTPKSKLFEELRENVYKEVANLISANENRPHFLIQLFRDLQLINSEPLRRKTLQSIQILITNSIAALENSRGVNTSRQPGVTEQEVVQVDSEYFSLQPSLWSQVPRASTSVRHSSNTEGEIMESDTHSALKEVVLYLNTQSDNILSQDVLETLKELIMQSLPLMQIFAHANIQDGTLYHRHFNNIVNEALEKYQGKIIREVKIDMLKTISNILAGECSFLNLIQENFPEFSDSSSLNDTLQTTSSTVGSHEGVMLLNLQPHGITNAEEVGTPQMQNGDLAEADQSRMELGEEGAVGGILNILADGLHSSLVDGGDADETDLPKIDFPINAEPEAEFVEQGLDQVPTRLTTHSRSHCNTPSRDRSSSSRSDPMEHF